MKEFKNKLCTFNGKKAIFATGAMSSSAQFAIQTIKNTFTEIEGKHIGAFYMQGGLNYNKMGLVNKSMMKMMSNMMKMQHGINSDEYKTIS